MSFKIGIREFDRVLKQALAQTYAYRAEFATEFDFKHELFHQLHSLEINGYKLGDKLPGCKTSMLHAEAKPINGLTGRNAYADLLICNPTIERRYNYRAEFVIELKKTLNAKKLTAEIDKFAKYNDALRKYDAVRKLYIASTNKPTIDSASIKQIISERKQSNASIEVLTHRSRNDVVTPQSRRRSRTKTPFSERVSKCVTATLNLYGKNRDDIYHSFFWRNYEYTNEGDWTFPCEGDFVAQLYHRLRVVFRQAADIFTDYRTPSARNKKVDLFVQRGDETVGVEVKMNYDNLFRGDEIPNILQKFDAMSHDHPNHTNFLIVIQGEYAHRVNREGVNRKADSLDRLRQKRFELFHYDEIRNKAIGPVSAEEAQKLAIR